MDHQQQLNDVKREGRDAFLNHGVSGERKHTSSAYLVFVALDDDGKPRPIPGLEPSNATERRRQREARIRRETRLSHREAIETHRAQVSQPQPREQREDPESRPHLRM